MREQRETAKELESGPLSVIHEIRTGLRFGKGSGQEGWENQGFAPAVEARG